jgi:hypothetical protein
MLSAAAACCRAITELNNNNTLLFLTSINTKGGFGGTEALDQA